MSDGLEKARAVSAGLGQDSWTFCSSSADVVAKVPVTMMQALAVGHFLHCDSPVCLWLSVTKCHPGQASRRQHMTS